jgi:alkylated DNA repair protein (DNA oxidative demethylase)
MMGSSGNLFEDIYPAAGTQEVIAQGAIVLRGFARAQDRELLAATDKIAAAAPFRHMTTPGGFVMSAAITSCGNAGWVTDRTGYRYTADDPDSGLPWPAMPACMYDLALRAAATADFDNFAPDACLINCYEPGARMSLHQDRNERDFSAPVVSVSLGLPATFLFGGNKRSDRPRRIRLEHGDVVVWGGPARLAFHGITALADGMHPLTGRRRINLTFRKVW